VDAWKDLDAAEQLEVNRAVVEAIDRVEAQHREARRRQALSKISGGAAHRVPLPQKRVS
jgi:hypothetical protein